VQVGGGCFIASNRGRITYLLKQGREECHVLFASGSSPSGASSGARAFCGSGTLIRNRFTVISYSPESLLGKQHYWRLAHNNGSSWQERITTSEGRRVLQREAWQAGATCSTIEPRLGQETCWRTMQEEKDTGECNRDASITRSHNLGAVQDKTSRLALLLRLSPSEVVHWDGI
jgi:hypothetical protein